MPKDEGKTSLVSATAEMVDMRTSITSGATPSSARPNAELDAALKHVAVLAAGKGLEQLGEVSELLEAALAKTEDERYKAKRTANVLAAAAANGDVALAAAAALQPLPFPTYAQLETNVQADTPQNKRLAAVQTGIALLKKGAQMQEEEAAADAAAAAEPGAGAVSSEYEARGRDRWRLVHAGASILHALLRRRQKRVLNLLALSAKDGIVALFGEVLEMGALDVLAAHCWRKPRDAADGTPPPAAAMGPSPAQLTVDGCLRELARNAKCRAALKQRAWHDVGFLLAIVRCPVYERWAEREKMGTANTEMVPQHWAIAQLRKRLELAEHSGEDDIAFGMHALREIYEGLHLCLRHRELHIEAVDIIGAHCVRQLNLGIAEVLELVHEAEFLKKLRKLQRFHKPLQKLAQLHMPVLSIQEIGYIFGEISDLAQRGKRLVDLCQRYNELRTADSAGAKQHSHCAASGDAASCAEQRISDYDALCNELIFNYIPEFMQGMAGYFHDLCDTAEEEDPDAAAGVAGAAGNPKRQYNVTIRGLNEAVKRRNFFLYLRHRYSERKGGHGGALRYRLTLWELLVMPAVYFPLLRQLCDKIEEQCRFPAIPEAKMAHLHDIFMHYDHNGNGHLEKAEVWEIMTQQQAQDAQLHESLRSLGLHPHPVNSRQREAFERNFAMVDIDKSGQIDFKEFLFIVAPHLIDDAHDRLVVAVTAQKQAESLRSMGGHGGMADDMERVAQSVGGTRMNVDVSVNAVATAVDTHFTQDEAAADAWQAEHGATGSARTVGHKQHMSMGQMATSAGTSVKSMLKGTKVEIGAAVDALAPNSKEALKGVLGHINAKVQSEWELAYKTAQTFEFECSTAGEFSGGRRQPLSWVYTKVYKKDQVGIDFHGHWVYRFRPAESRLALWLEDTWAPLGGLAASCLFLLTLPCVWRSPYMLQQLWYQHDAAKLHRLMQGQNDKVGFHVQGSNEAKTTRDNTEGEREFVEGRGAEDEARVATESSTVESARRSSSAAAERRLSEASRTMENQARAGNMRGSSGHHETGWKTIVHTSFERAATDVLGLFGYKALANIFDSQFVGVVGSAFFCLAPFLFTFAVLSRDIGAEGQMDAVSSKGIGLVLGVFVGCGFLLIERALARLWQSRSRTEMNKTDVNTCIATWWERQSEEQRDGARGCAARLQDRLYAWLAGKTTCEVGWRPVWANWMEVLGSCTEFVQLASFSFVASIPWPHHRWMRNSFDWAVLDLTSYLEQGNGGKGGEGGGSSSGGEVTFRVLVALLCIWIAVQLYFEVVVVGKGIALQDRRKDKEDEEAAAKRKAKEAAREAKKQQEAEDRSIAARTAFGAAFGLNVVTDAGGCAVARGISTLQRHVSKNRKKARSLTELFAAYVLPVTTGFFYMSVMVSIFSVFDCTGYGNSCNMLVGGGEKLVVCSSATPRELAAAGFGALLPPNATVAGAAPGVFPVRDDTCAPYGCYAPKAQQCFAGNHIIYTLSALVGFGLYFPSATLTPFQVYFIDPRRDIRYPPLYIMANQLLKCALSACATLLTDFWYAGIGASIVVNFLAAYINGARTPSNIMVMNHWKCTYFLMAGYSAICAVFAKKVDPDGAFFALVAGWVLLPLASFRLWHHSTNFGKNRSFHDHQTYDDHHSASSFLIGHSVHHTKHKKHMSEN